MEIDFSKFGVYIIENTATGQVYVGSTINSFATRLSAHYTQLSRGSHANRAMQQDWDKYGKGAFVFRSLEVCTTSEQASNREMHWIDVYAPHVYNYQSSVCPHCNASLTMGQYGVSIRRGYCNKCRPATVKVVIHKVTDGRFRCPKCDADLTLGAYGAATRNGYCAGCKNGVVMTSNGKEH